MGNGSNSASYHVPACSSMMPKGLLHGSIEVDKILTDDISSLSMSVINIMGRGKYDGMCSMRYKDDQQIVKVYNQWSNIEDLGWKITLKKINQDLNNRRVRGDSINLI